ncbi:Uncharacterized protein C2orf42,Uncharacterized protein C2orf42 homolog [Acanthosepion pharaonis]|uniref:Uncharacterized protein C2orf42,Uncharacterized protein C2orf42 homolog n=1 Tax=Acanthosepion pharaonis TaxID=158019 RepID=A0A812CSP4_ACAPH|nr:Uncharacterized protein C2orf42,Uncharacterized protein C2orf42 homolog [Sepia pharaonis]
MWSESANQSLPTSAWFNVFLKGFSFPSIALFGDLGKPTLRGVRKCPKCGTYNGTRGISCKNKSCDVVFKEKERKRGHSADAVKIITGSTEQVFSVRLRDRGPDYRGFVQLPFVQDIDGNPASEVTNETKQEIWIMATEITGPLVQRVTKNIMVVKCKASQKQPLGFLHFAFFETTRNRSQPEYKFQCSCKAFKNHKIGVAKEDSPKRCVHFYACICAFASDEKLAEEFAYYINIDSAATPVPEHNLITIYQQSSEGSVTPADTTAVEVIVSGEDLLGPSAKKKRKDDTRLQASSALLTLQEGGVTTRKSSPVKQTAQPPQQPAKTNTPPKKSATVQIDENSVAVTFHQWLGSVTERINQTMHYQFDGNPEPLVFHAPQVFFDCLQQRISSGNRKKRLPNYTTGFVRKDALPLGMFTKYTWHITNILQVKQIFDTADMPLEITRNFVENRDGTYDLYEVPKVQVENIDDTYKSKNQTPIRPFELKTFLKVGNTSLEQKDPTPFIIEWIPDILPKSHIGELRIKFEYGHQRNGHIEHRLIAATGSEIPFLSFIFSFFFILFISFIFLLFLLFLLFIVSFILLFLPSRFLFNSLYILYLSIFPSIFLLFTIFSFFLSF